MSDRAIVINFVADASDYRRVLLWYRWRRITLVLVFWLVIVIPIMYLIGFGAGATPTESRTIWPFTAMLLLVILPIAVLIASFVSLRRQAEKMARITENAIVTFDSNGIASVAKSTSSQMLWERLTKVCETTQDFIFFPQENIFYTIPKKLFSSEDEVDSLRSLLVTKLGKKAKVKK